MPPATGSAIRSRCGRCACSTGEEAYSIAISLAETFGTLTPAVSILASDVDTQVLHKAEEGVYPMERVERLGQSRVKRFSCAGLGPSLAWHEVRPELRNLVSFRRLNLLDPVWPARGPFDAIFCRNVMIYFDKATQAAMLQRFAPLLRPDGLAVRRPLREPVPRVRYIPAARQTVYEVSGAHSRAAGARR